MALNPSCTVLSGSSSSRPASAAVKGLIYVEYDGNNITQHVYSTDGSGTTWDREMQRLLKTNITASDTISNTAVATAFATKYTVPAGFLGADSCLSYVVRGVYSTTGSPTLALGMDIGGVGLTAMGAATVGTGVTNFGWEVRGHLVTVTTGGSGTHIHGGVVSVTTALGTSLVHVNVPSSTVTVDTTIANDLKLFATWNVADAANTITLRQFIIGTGGRA